MAAAAPLAALFKYVDEHQDLYVQRLADWVAIQSVSAWPEKRDEIKRMMQVAAKEVERLGGSCELVDIGKQKLPDGSEIALPPILLGRLGSDPGKKTVCVYGHLDVQPAALEDGWDSEPFVLEEREGKLYGRGSTDDKGPVLAWLNSIEAYQETKQEVPVNLKFCFEGMEESGSEGLDDLIFARKDTFFKDVDYVCISDNYWLGKNKPCITYGLRGICYFFIEVECCAKDLHSGVYGGSVHEAMTDLIALMGSLVDKKGKILIPGIYKTVAALNKEEEKIYEAIDFDLQEYASDIGATQLLHNSKPPKKKARKEKPKRKSTPKTPKGKKNVKSAHVKKADSSTTKKNQQANSKKEEVPESESETDSSDDEPLIKKVKKPPTDDELKETVKKLLASANLEEVTMKQICKKVNESYPNDDLTSRKDFIKAAVKELIS